MNTRMNPDRSGMIVSLACIIHCSVLPVLVGFAPTLGLKWAIHNPSIHKVFFALMVGLAGYAFVRKFQFHQRLQPAYWMLAGIIFVGVSHFSLMEHSPSHQSAHNHQQMDHQLHDTPIHSPKEYVSKTHQNHQAANHHGTMTSPAKAGAPLSQLPLATTVAVIGSLLLIRGHILNQKLKPCQSPTPSRGKV